MKEIFTGTVIQFDAKKGYGFIVPDDDTKDDIFVHWSAIQMEGFKGLLPEQRVQYSIGFNRKNQIIAVDVIVLENK